MKLSFAAHRSTVVLLVGAAACATAAGCSADFYRRQADRDSYAIVEAQQRAELGRAEPFSIEPTRSFAEELKRRNYTKPLAADAMSAGEAGGRAAQVLAAVPTIQLASLSELTAADAAAPATQPAAAGQGAGGAGWLAEPVELPPIEAGGRVFIEPGRWPPDVRRVGIVEAMQLTAANSRDFQARKESVYLAALALTGEQWNFESRFFGTVDATLAQTDRHVRSGTIDSALGFTRNFTTGGALAVTVSNTLFEVFTDPTSKRAESAINLALTQPILRGAGYRVAAEPLIQAAREVTYAVRDFDRFKRELAVTVASSFYRVLEQGDQVANERNNYANLVRARQRTEELAAAGRLPEFQVDQARQDELRARNRWILAVQRYNALLDGFRRTLGVPTDWPIVPAPDSLARLDRDSMAMAIPDADAAVTKALAGRQDLKTLHDEVEDAARRVTVAADALRAGLDLSAEANVPSNPNSNRPADLRFEFGQYSIGGMLDLPLDRLDERNIYRSAIVSLRSAQRALTDGIDRVSQEVRSAIRNLVQARNSYRIQAAAVTLAGKRVESTSLLLQAGRADTRDLLEAQAALVEAQNALTAAMVDYHLARLELLRDMETLQVEPTGLTYADPTADH